MVNLFYISIGQDDCPHTYLTGKIKDLTIFIMNTQELEDGYQTTFSLFFAKDVKNSLHSSVNNGLKWQL